ncbi:MAG: bifunctional demethylmenaquinone methyltransferase/2-methoxy-6-polyprenyl-1,4-benzoquinol methylase UbiE [Campylobacterota bacterium]
MKKENKQQEIVSMFDDIASTYDVANRVLSFGIDKRWRKIGCDKTFSMKKDVATITDVACGTGDLLLFWNTSAKKHGIDVENYIGVDPAVNMLECAKEKVGFATFKEGKAQHLPLDDESSDIISISYGIRNVVDRKEALAEFYRVLKPGGMVVILEFTKQEKKGISSLLTDTYTNKILPTVGGMISKNYKAYRYLPDSIEDFLTTKMLQDELSAVGFTLQYTKSFSFGISTLLIAQKPYTT